MPVKRIILLLAALLLTNLHGAGQDRLSDWLHPADSIVIISHQTLFRRAGYAEMSRGISGYPLMLVSDSGHTTDSLIVARRRLDVAGRDTLISLLNRSYKDTIPFSPNMCFVPHHAVLCYRRGRCAYLSLCFGCLRYSLSPGLTVPPGFLETQVAWEALQHFFTAHHIPVELKTD